MRKPFQVYTFICKMCGREFTARKSHAQTCSTTCRSIKFRSKKSAAKVTMKSLDCKGSKDVPESDLNNTDCKPGLVDAVPVDTPSNESFQYEIYTTCYGTSFCFSGFERALFSVLGDQGTISDFEIYLLKRRQFNFHLGAEDLKKVECLKIILENREIILKSIWLCEEGCNRFKGKVLSHQRMVSTPEFQYHY
jgi:hypothetical protein